MTPTITPTSFGGGSGQIICEYCNGKPGMSLINFDGTGEIYLTDKQSMGASFGWSKNGAKLAYFTIEGVTLPMEERKFFTCVIDGDNFSEQCFEIGGGSFSLSPEGSKMAIGEFSPALYLVDFDSGKSEMLMEAPKQWGGFDVDWSPDGTKLVVAGKEIGITVIDFVTNDKYSVVEADKPDYYTTPRWSPDGKKIAYVKRSNLFVVNADGSGETLLVQNAIYPLWSPDGTKIAYITGSNDQRKIIMMNMDGTNKIRLTPSHNIYEMTWSSDGNFIVYLTFNGSRGNPIFDLYSVEVTRQEVFSVAKNTGIRGYTLSPDGSMIAYTSFVKGEDPNSYVAHQYLSNMDGTIISELHIPGGLGPWRPTSVP
jgi:Tol biopolymer transport system component